MTPPPSASDTSPTVDLIPQPKFPVPVPDYTSTPPKYPIITRCELDLTTVIRRTRVREREDSLVRSVSAGKCRGQNVLVVQYSSQTRRENAMKVRLSNFETDGTDPGVGRRSCSIWTQWCKSGRSFLLHPARPTKASNHLKASTRFTIHGWI